MTARVSSPVTRTDAASLDRQFGDQIALLVPMLRRFAHRLCGQRALADDLTQEAIMRAWAARATFIQNTDLRAWVCVILRNCFYTSLRHGKWSASWDPELAEHVLTIQPAQEDALLLDDAMKAIDHLSSGQRQVLMMVGIEGLSYKEAAVQCGCAPGTIKSRMARGRRVIAQTIAGPDDETMFQRCAGGDTSFATLSRKGA
ncbi:RNA polymerase sigma-70 factor (ECF subfamily) [Novosphingobium sp. SG751A]|uniref:sigma-70 family RNA polymerase sigma factor n=1 Tax=Novosphingobium sp. SG751A TaxID=2587000 RepID=UPI0015564297|nr:sigma-70 family RNA polymerase sigma factor [Novosphingobium sp. SG751A]NOW46469.1 RNA polymerase sigma-70 factor (ECF subfamily) [Novosphingobium sp. SG751A]